MNQTTCLSKSWSGFIREKVGSAVDLAALLNVTPPTARTYKQYPQRMKLEQIYVLSVKTDTSIKELVKLILLHND